MNITVQSAGSQFSAIRSTEGLQALRAVGCGLRFQIVIQHIIGRIVHRWSTPSAGSAPAVRLSFPTTGSRMVERVLDIRPAPAQPRFGHLEIAPRALSLRPLMLDAGIGPAQHLARLMFADHTGDVIVDHHHLVHQPLPLARRTSRSWQSHSRPASAPPARYRQSVASPGLHDHAWRHHQSSVQPARLLQSRSEAYRRSPCLRVFDATGQVIDPAERQHPASHIRRWSHGPPPRPAPGRWRSRGLDAGRCRSSP